jgi:uncharacterized OB-fold protein
MLEEQFKRDASLSRGNMIDKVCDKCGSDQVRLLAWMEWDVEQQRWRISMDGTEEDRVWCKECESETQIYEQEWPEEEEK